MRDHESRSSDLTPLDSREEVPAPDRGIEQREHASGDLVDARRQVDLLANRDEVVAELRGVVQQSGQRGAHVLPRGVGARRLSLLDGASHRRRELEQSCGRVEHELVDTPWLIVREPTRDPAAERDTDERAGLDPHRVHEGERVTHVLVDLVETIGLVGEPAPDHVERVAIEVLGQRGQRGAERLPMPSRAVQHHDLRRSNVGAATRFYCDALGLAVTEEVTYDGERLAFLRTGTEHHTVALLPISLRERLGLDARTTLAAYGMQIASYRQLRDARAFLENEGRTIVDLPTELHTGIDYAFHVVDPDGHCVRLYHEMEQVGSSGQPLGLSQPRTVERPWPATLTPVGATSPNLTFQGPLG
jgi:catechol 2,3-dioxygenase-like lactoylglutathione lyase family enzyme